MPRELIKEYVRRDAEKAADVARVQLKNLFAQGQIAKLEAQMAKREQLADGLALIDFEQLKIENGTLVEKIDARNEELGKLRRKTTTAVQSLTHVREKSYFVNADAARLRAELAALEAVVAEQRHQLGHNKKARERTRVSIEAGRHMQGFAHNDRLAIDFEMRKESVMRLKGELARRVAYYHALQEETQAVTQRIAGASAGGSMLSV
jgi:chromosome segregation ATPase